MKKRFLSVVLALILSLSFVSSAFAMSYHENDIEKYIIGQLSNARIPGGEVSIVTSGREVYSASYGDVPETDSDLKIGVLSRVFTSISILQLADSQKLTLDTKIEDIISGSVNKSGITVEDLLRQTGGYTMTQKMSSDSIPAPLGKKGKYQDARINYAILGKVVEEVSGVKYAEYIKKNIIEPLHLKSTYTTDEMSGKDIVGGHDNLFGLPIARKAENTDAKGWDAVPATGIISDAKDMGNVLSMFLAAGGKTLSYDQIEKVYSDGTNCGNTIFDTKGTSSLGWIKTKVGGQDVYYVSGAIDGYISSTFLVPGQDLGITMLFDTSDVVSGNDVIEELMSNVVCLAMGQKARTIDSKAVMLPHIEFDIVYLIVFLVSLVPMLLMSWWYRTTRKEGIGIVKTIVDAAVHIGLPVVVYKCVPPIIGAVLGESFGSWFMIKKFLPECYYVTLLIEAVLIAGIPVKVIAGVIAIKKGPLEENEGNEIQLSDEDKDRNIAVELENSDENSIADEEELKGSVEEADEAEKDVKDNDSKSEQEKVSKDSDSKFEEEKISKDSEIKSEEETISRDSEEKDSKDNDKKVVEKLDDTEDVEKSLQIADTDVEENSNSSETGTKESSDSVTGLDDIAEEVAATTEENTNVFIERTERKKRSRKGKKKNSSGKAMEKKKTEIKKKEEEEPEEIVKEFRTRKKDRQQEKEEYGSSFEREAIKALESDGVKNEQTGIDDELSDINSDSKMQTTVPKIKKRYHHQKGMPVKIVVEPDDDLDN